MYLCVTYTQNYLRGLISFRQAQLITQIVLYNASFMLKYHHFLNSLLYSALCFYVQRPSVLCHSGRMRLKRKIQKEKI